MGTDSAIFRTLGKQTAMRTDQYNSRWLNGNVSTRGLFRSQLFPLPHSSLSRPILIYSSALEVAAVFHLTSHMSPPRRPAHRAFLELCHPGMGVLIFPHGHMIGQLETQSARLLIGGCMPAEPGSEGQESRSKGK